MLRNGGTAAGTSAQQLQPLGDFAAAHQITCVSTFVTSSGAAAAPVPSSPAHVKTERMPSAAEVFVAAAVQDQSAGICQLHLFSRQLIPPGLWQPKASVNLGAGAAPAQGAGSLIVSSCCTKLAVLVPSPAGHTVTTMDVNTQVRRPARQLQHASQYVHAP